MFYVILVRGEHSPCDSLYPACTLDRAVSIAKHQRKSYYAVVFDSNGQKMFEHGTPVSREIKLKDYVNL